MSEADRYMLEWGPNWMEFSAREDLEAFAREQGATSVTYRPIWHTQAQG